MRKLIASALIAGSALFGCGKDVPKESAAPSKLEAGIERELRKADFWVEGLVEQDYTSGAKSKAVSIRKLSPQLEQIYEKIGASIADGSYLPKKKELSFREKGDIRAVLDAVDHELSHAAYDTIIESEGYSGPSKKEIADYCANRVSGPEFDQLRNLIKLQKTLSEINASKELQKEYYEKGGIKDRKIRTIANRINNELAYLEADEKKEFGDKLKSFTSSMGDAIKEYNTVQIQLKTAVEPLMNVEKMGTDEFEKSYAKLKTAGENFKRQHENVTQAVDQFYDSLSRILDASEEREYKSIIADLKNSLASASTEAMRKRILDEIKSTEEAHKTAETKKSLGYSFETLAKAREDVANYLNDNSSSQILTNPDEVLARLVDSMYSLHFGEIMSNKFPISDEDLKFLGKFTYNGRQMFEKGISKYRLAMQMVKDGIAPDSAKKQLEYAVNFEYKGQKYAWPETKFRIRGNIPYNK